jgi:hypothetical protein
MPASYTQKGVVRPELAGFEVKRHIGLSYAAHAEHLRHTSTPLLDAIRSRYPRTHRS